MTQSLPFSFSSTGEILSSGLSSCGATWIMGVWEVEVLFLNKIRAMFGWLNDKRLGELFKDV